MHVGDVVLDVAVEVVVVVVVVAMVVVVVVVIGVKVVVVGVVVAAVVGAAVVVEVVSTTAVVVLFAGEGSWTVKRLSPNWFADELPMPSCPIELSPQHPIFPLLNVAHVCVKAELTDVAVVGSCTSCRE